MFHPATISTADELAVLLARCGFTSEPWFAVPWTPWQREWRDQTMPISRHLTGFGATDYFVTIEGDSVHVYFLDPLNDWFYIVGEVQGVGSEADVQAMLARATSAEAVPYWRQKPHQSDQ
jgi:hypothetical protein